MDDKERHRKLVALAAAFRPSGPIDTGDLFAGRTGQIIQVGNTLAATGRHAVIYGERGVGKTSLAAVSAEFFPIDLALRVNCDPADSFADLWCRVGDEAQQLAEMTSWSLGSAGRGTVQAANKVLESADDLSPDRIRHYLRVLSDLGLVTVFFDEYDQIQDEFVHSLMANTMKSASDHGVTGTIVLVGVADDVEALISEHESIERNLEEVPMPRMDHEEISQIIDNGYEKAGLEIADQEVRERLIRLPQGLPHFAHLLAQQAGRAAVLRGESTIASDHLRTAIEESVASSDASLTRLYHDATDSAHDDALFGSVLLSCALAPVDDLGYFSPGDLREPLFRVTGERYEIPRFARHLVAFCRERGPVLERKGGERRWRYRFINPRTRPYVILRAIKDGIPEELLDLSPAPISPQLPFVR